MGGGVVMGYVRLGWRGDRVEWEWGGMGLRGLGMGWGWTEKMGRLTGGVWQAGGRRGGGVRGRAGVN